MSRRLGRDNRTKVRNIPRRLKALNRWAETFHDPEFAIIPEGEYYWNFKIPVDINLVQGKHSTQKIKAACAQALIDACGNLIRATADGDNSIRITTVISLPDMFNSEVCLYRSEEYYQCFVTEGYHLGVSLWPITGRSLVAEWQLQLPAGVHELGMKFEDHSSDDPEDWYAGERWYYGQVV